MAKDPEKSLTLAELRQVRGQLAGATGKRRLDLIFDASDPGALIRALPPDELYFTIREIGLADAVELVQLASAEQFKVILDLDAWRQGRFEPRRALPWLRAARVGALDDPKAASRLARKMRALDPEIALLLFRDALRIHDLKVEEDPDIESDRTFRSPDGAYLVEFLVDGTDYVAIRGLIDDLEAEDAFKLSRLFASLAWELPSELEETALRWRTGRLADLGFPSLEEALSWYARPPTRPAEAPGSPSRAPGFFLAPLAGGTLLGRAAARLEAEDREGLELQLVGAGNAVLVADGIDPVDLDQVRAAVDGARAMVELGLAHLAGGDEARAAEVLAATPVKRLFQEGFGRVLALCWRAERLFKAGGAGTRAAPLLDAPLGEALTALSGRRPRYWPGLDLPRGDWGTPAASAQDGRRFLGEADLARTAAALDLCEGLAALATELGLVPGRADAAGPRLSALYLTALANQRLGRPFAPAPLAAAELPEAAARLEPLDDPRLSARGEAGALLLALARERAEELRATLEQAASSPELITAVLVSP
ncbi:MAG: hypothetical protein IPQ24_08165 [Anaeromyxobacter sp.]|nr:hypothetical protein [Anaeromyxobacter sp.]